MTAHTRSHYVYTRRWLEQRFGRVGADGVFFAHMPIYGHAHPASEPGRLPRLARALQVLRALDGLEFATLLDVGGAEGWLAWTVERAFGARAVSADLSVEASRRARELFGVAALATDAERLPFADRSFDVVVCTEVLEHVEHPVHVLLELQRVARRAVVLTTEEVSDSREHVAAWLARRCGYPHGERNRFVVDDFVDVWGDGVRIGTQFLPPRPPEPADDAAARAWLIAATPDTPGLQGAGIVVVHLLDRTAARPPSRDKAAWIDALLAARIDARPTSADRAAATAAALDLTALRDPVDGSPLAVVATATGGTALEGGAGRSYPIVDGVPCLHARGHREPERGDLVDALTGRVPTERAVRILALHDRLFLPTDAGRTDWDFRDPSARRGFGPFGADIAEQPRGDAIGWTLRATGPDPAIVGPTMPWRTGDLAAVAVTMRLHNPDYPVDAGVGQLFWMTTDDADFAEEHSVLFPVRNDGGVHTYRIDLAAVAHWPRDADLVCLRLDPVNGPADLELLRFRLLPSS